MADKDRRGDDEAENTEAKASESKKDAGSARKSRSGKDSDAVRKRAEAKMDAEEAKESVSAGKADSVAKTEKKPDPTKKAGEGEGGHGRGPARFVREVIEQLRKVTRPNRKELLTYTVVVLVFVSVMIALISGLDLGFTKLIALTFGSSGTGQ